MGLKNEGKTNEDLLADSVFQQASVDCITNFINGLSIDQQKTLDVICQKNKGADGKFYWAPVDSSAVMNFVQRK